MTDLTAVLSAIRELPNNIRMESLDILTRNAELIAGTAQILVHVKSGYLRDSIHTEITEDTEQRVTVAVKASAPYAAIIEEEYPFMAPAVDSVIPQLEAELRDRIQRVINEQVAKHGNPI